MSTGWARLLKRTAVLLAAALVLLLLYGLAVPRLVLDERRLTAEVPGLDPSWDGQQVAVFSDLQVGMWLANTAMVERVVDRTVEAQPAAVLIPGDFLYSESPDVVEQIDEVLALLRPITAAGLPTFAVLGNHDYAVSDVDLLVAALEGAGIDVLQNSWTVVPPPPGVSGEPLHVVGLGPALTTLPVPSLADAERALDGLPDSAPRIAMMHNPTSFPQLPAGSAPFAVAGHTHCGQIALPGTPRWSYVGLTAEEEVVADGFAPKGYGAPGNSLFVTCGIGFSVVPVRINAPPQLVLVELTRPD